jgi:hypothetical protein
VRLGGAIAGAALLALALWWVLRDGTALRQAWTASRAAPAWQLALLLGLPLVSWLLTGVIFWLLTAKWRGFGHVRPPEMMALVGASWLLNLLPLRPGMVGRVAYLKAVRGVPIRESVVVGIAAAACTAISAVLLAISAAWIMHTGLDACPWATPTLVLSPAALLAGVALVARRTRGERGVRAAAMASTLAFRIIDMGLMGARLMIAFAVIGKPIGAGQGLWLAGPAQAVGLLPIHLGAQEWAVGLLAATASAGITAALANRLADTLVSIFVGSICLLWLWRRAPGLSPTRPHGFAGNPQPPA